MDPAEKHRSRVDCLVLERWTIEESLTTLRAASRKLLRAHASLDRIRAMALALRAALKIKAELDRQLTESHCTIQFVYPL
jgi:hypothetical protein